MFREEANLEVSNITTRQETGLVVRKKLNTKTFEWSIAIKIELEFAKYTTIGNTDGRSVQ